MKQLTIEHNHGVVVLKDAYLVEEHGAKYAKGICIDGGVTNSLFGHTSYQPFTVGAEMLYPCYRALRCTDHEQDHWVTSVVSCG
ncbi:hypothetical protein ZHS_93 [Edwardsiella phage vB_EpM_ZHS]|jgi:hypothetical protein|nr:hypothetical protein ZHS_93 [Edwardsiella phage vB_EpM_ZHS]